MVLSFDFLGKNFDFSSCAVDEVLEFVLVEAVSESADLVEVL